MVQSRAYVVSSPVVQSALSMQAGARTRSPYIPVFTVYITSASTTVSVLHAETVLACYYRTRRTKYVPLYARAAAPQNEYES